jgi:NitT/TauT family transport system ATP-binding protein
VASDALQSSASAGVGVQLSGVVRRFSPTSVVGVESEGGISLSVGAGEFVVLIGASGCGKSTVLRMVGALDEATSGTVTVAGRAPSAAAADKLVGVVPQEPALLAWRSVRANATLLTEVGRRATGSGRAVPEVDELLAAVGLAHAANMRPHQLSGGMRQRVALVRALMLGAPLLLMDEPFAALDEITRTGLRALLRRLRSGGAVAGATVLFTTHSLAEAVLLGDRVVVMGPGGRVVGDHRVSLGDLTSDALDQADIEDDPRFVSEVATIRRLLHAATRGGAAA